MKAIKLITKFKLSIIIPIYNSESYLANCIDSVCKQANKNVELILINDGSKDESIKICKNYNNPYGEYLKKLCQ